MRASPRESALNVGLYSLSLPFGGDDVTVFILGTVLGFFFGLTGSGGSTLAVPLLVYGFGMPAHRAVCVSMISVSFMALARSLASIRNGVVQYQAAMTVAVAGLFGVPAGVWVGRFLPEDWLLATFAIVVAAIAWQLLRRTKKPEASSRPLAAVQGAATPELAVMGFFTGLLAGLLGVGGGFLIVPLLVLVCGLDVVTAISTSMFSVALISIVAMIAHWFGGQRPPLAITALFTAGALAGLAPGSILANKIPGDRLQRIFAVILLLLAGFILTRNFLAF